MTQLTLMLMKIFRLSSVGFEPGTYLRSEFAEKSMYDKKKQKCCTYLFITVEVMMLYEHMMVCCDLHTYSLRDKLVHTSLTCSWISVCTQAVTRGQADARRFVTMW